MTTQQKTSDNRKLPEVCQINTLSPSIPRTGEQFNTYNGYNLNQFSTNSQPEDTDMHINEPRSAIDTTPYAPLAPEALAVLLEIEAEQLARMAVQAVAEVRA